MANLKGGLKTIKSAESTISMFLGILVVVIVGVLLFNYFRNFSVDKKPEDIKLDNQPESKDEKVNSSFLGKHLVKKGETLWKISELYYKSGYNWVDISQENKLTNPGIITEGQELIIPKVETKNVAVLAENENKKVLSSAVIAEETYTVKKGDTLWNISVRSYQDGYRWPEIAKANSLTNPNIIHPGNILRIPR